MKKSGIMMTIILVIFLFACSNQPAIKPPVAEKIPHELFDKFLVSNEKIKGLSNLRIINL